MNRPNRRALLALACAALCAGLPVACGDSDDPPDAAAASTLRQTTAATSKLASARVTGSFELAPEGLLALGGPITLSATGPIAFGAGGELPRFDLSLSGVVATRDLRAGAISTGKAIFLRIDGRDYRVDASATPDAGHARRGGAPKTFAGLDPSAWIADPRNQGRAKIGGDDTIHIAGTLDVQRLLADIAKLLGAGTHEGGLLSPKLREQIDAAVKASKVDVWTGAKDKVLRQLVVVVDFAFATGESPIAGLVGGKITLRLRLDDVNATTVAPKAPAGARPLSQLTGKGGLGALLDGIGAAITGGGTAGGGADALLACLGSSTATTSDVVRCVSKLAP